MNGGATCATVPVTKLISVIMKWCVDTVHSLDTKKGGAMPNKNLKSLEFTGMILLRGEWRLN